MALKEKNTESKSEDLLWDESGFEQEFDALMDEAPPEKKPDTEKKKIKKPKKQKKSKAAPAEELPTLEEDALPEAPEIQAEPEPKGKKKHKHPLLRKIKITLIVVLILAVLLFIAAAVGGYYVSNLGETLPNVYINNVSVGGLDEYEVDDALKASGWDEDAAKELTVKLPAGIEFKVKYLDAGARISREEAVKRVCEYGHTRNWFKNLYEYGLNYITPANLEVETELKPEYISKLISTAAKELSDATQDTGYEIDKERSVLTFVKGAGQIKLDEAGLLTAIEEALKENKSEISYDKLEGEFVPPDFKALHDKLSAEPAEAYFTENFEVVDEVNGCWFEIPEAEKIWQNAKALELVEIPVTLTYPEVTGDSLRAMLYRDKLGEQTTYFPNSVPNRINNIQKVADKINGMILMPGEVFSYNETVGERTAAAGFLPAGAYEDGQVIEANGGGICQVSSTLYCATMFANLDTVSRTSHYFKVDYLPLGMDATVSWKKPDFKFRNSRDYPIKIVADCDTEGKSITVQIWGTDVDGSYVQFRHETYTRYDEEYPDVAIGYYVLGFRQIYNADGTLIKEIKEPASDYNFHEEDIQWPPEKFASEEGAQES